MAYIRTIGDDEAEGALKRQYDEAFNRVGKIYSIVRIFGLRPDTLKKTIWLYQQVMFSPSGLSRAEREMLAVVTSQVNHCHY